MLNAAHVNFFLQELCPKIGVLKFVFSSSVFIIDVIQSPYYSF